MKNPFVELVAVVQSKTAAGVKKRMIDSIVHQPVGRIRSEKPLLKPEPFIGLLRQLNRNRQCLEQVFV